MKNPIKEIFDNLSDEELKELIGELQRFKITGIIPSESKLCEKITAVAKITGSPYSSEIIGVSYMILERGSVRFLELLESNKTY